MSLPHFVDATAAKRGLGRRLFVDIDALAANWKLLQSRVQPAECSAVVKANAFGIGAKPVVHRLMLAAAKLSSSQTWRKLWRYAKWGMELGFLRLTATIPFTQICTSDPRSFRF